MTSRESADDDTLAPAGSSEIFEFVVPPEAGGSRLDAFLGDALDDVSRSALKRHVEKGRVTVDGTPAKKGSASVRAGQRIVVDLPPPPPVTPLPEDIPLDVIYDDDHLLVIDKAPGIVVHPSPGVDPSGTLVNALLAQPGDLSTEGGEFRPGIVHRLDRETSGVICVARNDAAHRNVAAQFKARTVSKTYLAFSHGRPRETSGTIDLAIGRSFTVRKKMAIRTDESAKPSRTDWLISRTLGSDYTWFECHPFTGRTHQIRLHLKAIGHPILCDALYGREKHKRYTDLHPAVVAEEGAELTRHALHAHRLELDHPTTGERMTFESPLPADLAPLWDAAEPFDEKR